MKNYFEILFLEEAQLISKQKTKRNENIHLRSSSRQAHW